MTVCKLWSVWFSVCKSRWERRPCIHHYMQVDQDSAPMWWVVGSIYCIHGGSPTQRTFIGYNYPAGAVQRSTRLTVSAVHKNTRHTVSAVHRSTKLPVSAVHMSTWHTVSAVHRNTRLTVSAAHRNTRHTVSAAHRNTRLTLYAHHTAQTARKVAHQSPADYRKHSPGKNRREKILDLLTQWFYRHQLYT